MKIFFLTIFSLLIPFYLFSETDFYFENNTTLELNITTTQWSTDSDPLGNDEWSPYDGLSYPWQNSLRVLQVNRDDGIHNGKNFYQEVEIEHNGESVFLQCWVQGEFIGSDMKFSIRGNGFDHTWYGQNNGSFHEETITFAGKQMILKYKRENNIPYEENVRFALHELNVYQNPGAADLSNPNVMNLFCYNVGLLMPAGVADQDENERAEHLPDEIPTTVDVIVTQEAFDAVGPFLDGLFPNYNHRTIALNQDNVDIPGVTKDGGVYILSKWPIEMEADLDFQAVGIPCDNGAWNCAARKGVKYARINKLGIKYHIFGTHLEAGNSAISLEQLDSFKTFVESFNIPENEAVLFAGDFNIGMDDDPVDYPYILNTLNAIEPTRTGVPYTNTTSNFNHYKDLNTQPGGRIIDHVFSSYNHLMPIEAINEARTMRSLHDDMWNIFDLSDHEAVMSYFVYPNVDNQPVSNEVCWQETVQLTASMATMTEGYQWYKDGQILTGETDMTLNIFPFDVDDVGAYYCELQYAYSPDSTSNSMLTDYPYDYPGILYNGLLTDEAILDFTVTDCNPTIIDNSGELSAGYPFGTYQWYDENGPISGATDANYIPISSGNYYVVVSYNGNDSNPSNEIYIIISNVEELAGNQFEILPNPSRGLFYIQFDHAFSSEVVFELYHQHGQLLMTKHSLGSSQIDASHLPKGIYHLRMNVGEEVVVRKVVVQ